MRLDFKNILANKPTCSGGEFENSPAICRWVGHGETAESRQGRLNQAAAFVRLCASIVPTEHDGVGSDVDPAINRWPTFNRPDGTETGLEAEPPLRLRSKLDTGRAQFVCPGNNAMGLETALSEWSLV